MNCICEIFFGCLIGSDEMKLDTRNVKLFNGYDKKGEPVYACRLQYRVDDGVWITVREVSLGEAKEEDKMPK